MQDFSILILIVNYYSLWRRAINPSVSHMQQGSGAQVIIQEFGRCHPGIDSSGAGAQLCFAQKRDPMKLHPAKKFDGSAQWCFRFELMISGATRI